MKLIKNYYSLDGLLFVFGGKDIKKNLEECVQVVEETVFEVKMSWGEYEE